MDETPNLGLPYIMAAQAQKHVTHNEAIRALDAIVQLAVLDRDLGAPPPSPGEGDRYIVAAGATGAWSGHAGEIAAFQDGAWLFYVPAEGWIAWLKDEDAAVVWDGADWSALASGGGGPDAEYETVGINATADATNRLAVGSPSTLLNHAGAGHQLKINKAAGGDTGTLLYQTGFSGRAEMGLAGDDDFHFKVSPDGSTWYEALIIDRASGAVRLPLTKHASFGARGIACANNAATPNSQFDLDADEIVLRDANGNAVLSVNPGATITNNIATAGPAANGRDQPGAFSSNSWAHFYWISNGTTLATLSSASVPPTGPALPSGYTYWAYAGAVRLNGSGNLRRVRIRGNTVYFKGVDNPLSGGSATSATLVDISASIPPNALRALFSSVGTLTSGVGGACAENVLIGVASGDIDAAYGVYVPVASQTASGVLGFSLPNDQQRFYYNWSGVSGGANVGTRNLTVFMHGYVVPNGGE